MLCRRARERPRPFPFFFYFSDVKESRGETGRQGEWRRESGVFRSYIVHRKSEIVHRKSEIIHQCLSVFCFSISVYQCSEIDLVFYR